MTHIALPNGTVINVKTIISVKAFPRRTSAGTEFDPSVVVVYSPTPSQAIHEEVSCDSNGEANDLRDRIIARLNEHTSIIPV